MLRIVYPSGFREEIAASAPDTMSVHAYGHDGHEIFSLNAHGKGAARQLKSVLDQIRSHGATVKSEAGAGDTRIEAMPQPGVPAAVVATADLGNLPALRESLLQLDQGGHLAPATMRHWLEAAESRQALHQLETAFQCGVAALERGRLPHLRLRIKDDTSDKQMAARITFDNGKQADGVAMILRLARNYLKLLEDAWK